MAKSLRLGVVGAFLSVTVMAQQGPVVRPAAVIGPDKTLSTLAGRTRDGAHGLISGTAVDADTNPIPNVTMRLRNLLSQQIEQVASASVGGEFSFIVLPEVPYVVEIADSVGRILAVGDVVTAQAGGVAGTVVAVPTKMQAAAGVFNETAGSVVSAATGTGMTMVEAGLLPLVSPER